MYSQGVKRVGRFTIRYRECRHCGTVHRTREEVFGVPEKYKPREKPRAEVRQKKLWDVEKPNAGNGEK